MKKIDLKGNELILDPKEHKSTTTDYGVGDADNYGHLKLTDTPDSSQDTTKGVAMTPKGVDAAVSTGVTTAEDLANATGTLAVGHGGTGITSNPSLQVNLASTSAASVFATSPRPGVTGTLPLGNGGTGRTTAPTITVQLNNTNTGQSLLPAGTGNVTTGITGTLGKANGGTGSTNFGISVSGTTLVITGV